MAGKDFLQTKGYITGYLCERQHAQSWVVSILIAQCSVVLWLVCSEFHVGYWEHSRSWLFYFTTYFFSPPTSFLSAADSLHLSVALITV